MREMLIAGKLLLFDHPSNTWGTNVIRLT